MRRREFIGLVGSAAIWSVAARAQQGERPRRIGVLIGLEESDPHQELMSVRCVKICRC
jgi:putative tryptophan/tyrosine transport system substrate-binding protein